MNSLEFLRKLFSATRARLSGARQADGLKAAEMLAMKWGWNEPERVNVQSGEVKVDAALAEQLRAVYAELGAARQKHALCALRRPPHPGRPASSATTFG